MLLTLTLYAIFIITIQYLSFGESIIIFGKIKKIFHNVPKISINVGIRSISSSILSLGNRLSKNGMFNELSTKYQIQEPWNAPKFVWTYAWKLHAIMLPILHYFDKCSPQDTFVNLSVLWWKSISGNNRHSPLFDHGIAYDFLPPFMRIIVSYPLCLVYPKLHHQNVALRTLYLDDVVEEHLKNNSCTLLKSSSSSSSSPKIHVLTLGAGFDTRSLRLALKYHNHTTWHEFDLANVIQQKHAILNRYLKRRQRFYNRILNRENILISDLIPKLYSINMNNISSVVESLHSSFSNISIQKDDTVLFITEASILYLNQSIVASLLSSCMNKASAYVNPSNIKYCFADRFPLPCTDFMTSSTVRTITNSTITMTATTTRNNNNNTNRNVYDIDVEVEKKEVTSFFHNIGMTLNSWQIKPGRARHMGVASVC